MKKTFTISALLLCLVILVTYDVLFVAMRRDAAPVIQSQQESVKIQNKESVPARVTISRLGIDMPVELGTYNAQKKTWTLSWSAASFASMTATPNAVSGRTVIYAHNTKKTFGPTKNIQPGDMVTVTTEDGVRYTYTFSKEAIVAPEDTSLFRDVKDGPPELVLLTCGGLFNQTRRLMHFEFVKIEKI